MRKSNIKDSIMMPPPKARQKSISDTSEELRKNLLECGNSSSCDNIFFQEEIHKYFTRENEDQEYKRIDEELSISKSTESFLNEKSTNYYNNNSGNNIINQFNSPSVMSNNNNIFNLENKNQMNSFNFNMVNYIYNDADDSEESTTEYKKSLENLKFNLSSEAKLYSKFSLLPAPTNNTEINLFVYNLDKYISEHFFDSNFQNLKIKLQTRFNDYKNKGLNIDYFKDTLIKMQKELISRITKQYNGDKKIENGILSFYQLIKTL